MFTTLPISRIQIASDRQRKDLGNLNDLKDSISKVGLINPIVVDDDYNLIAGERRLTSCKELGWTDISVQRLGDLSPTEQKLVELDENIRRKELTWQERAQAIADWHNLSKQEDPDWNYTRTSEELNLDKKHISVYCALAKEIAEGNEMIANAATYSTAAGILERKVARQKDNEDQRIAALQSPSSLGRSKSTNQLTEDLPSPTSSVDTASQDLGRSPFYNHDFIQWLEEYDGEPFNFLHCDFPYGIGAYKHDQGQADKYGGYDDSDQVYYNLIEALRTATEAILTESAHMLFWFSHNNYTSTKRSLESMGWKVNPTPLIWHKSDNSGILPDPKRGPRQIYEAAFLCTRGDRFIVRAKSNVASFPNKKQYHMSEKPRDMLNHFFQMFVDDSTHMLDPTCGSGNSVIECLAMGGRAEGIELNTEFYNNAVINYTRFQDEQA